MVVSKRLQWQWYYDVRGQFYIAAQAMEQKTILLAIPASQKSVRSTPL
jgi:hypothetical protein